MSIFSVTARLNQALTHTCPHPYKGRVAFNCALLAGAQDRRQAWDFSPGSNWISAIGEVLLSLCLGFLEAPRRVGLGARALSWVRVGSHADPAVEGISPFVLLSLTKKVGIVTLVA